MLNEEIETHKYPDMPGENHVRREVLNGNNYTKYSLLDCIV
jgi:hypothetical protein